MSDDPALRPTPDRVRETLFNWLAPDLPEARCLDLFAGTGALGLEAASRGAGEVVLIERSRRLVTALRAVTTRLGANRVCVVHGDAVRWLERNAPAAAQDGGHDAARPFDLVFVDPPYASGLYDPALQALVAGGWLRPGSAVYIECAGAEALGAVPDAWRLRRAKTTGQVRYNLFTAT